MNTPRNTMNGKPVFTVPSQTVLNLESGFSHKLLCDGPTFSTGTACAYSCAFCYVPDVMRQQVPWLKSHGVDGRHEDVVIRRENAIEVLARQLAAPKARALAEKELVIYSSPLVDVAANMDLVRETVEACRLVLATTRWHIRLLSKSNLLPKVAESLAAERSTLNAQRRVIYGLSTGTLNDRLAAAFEQGCPLVSKRLAALHWLQDHGFRTYGMICPSLPQGDYERFSAGIMEAIRAPKCEHVWAEVINVRGESFTRTEAELRGAGLNDAAADLNYVATDREAWELYARRTFNAHVRFCPPGKLRFLQYVTKDSRAWWAARQPEGAILL